jgi:hypothetical protein
MFSQITTATNATAGMIIAVITALAAIAKKYIGRKSSPPKSECIKRAEFHAGLDAIRDRIGASSLALADKIELQHKQVLTALDRQGASLEHRLDKLESFLAQVEERAKRL